MNCSLSAVQDGHEGQVKAGGDGSGFLCSQRRAAGRLLPKVAMVDMGKRHRCMTVARGMALRRTGMWY